MLLPENSKLFVFGRIQDWQAFDDEVFHAVGGGQVEPGGNNNNNAQYLMFDQV
jgi:hypothetical protein